MGPVLHPGFDDSLAARSCDSPRRFVTASVRSRRAERLSEAIRTIPDYQDFPFRAMQRAPERGRLQAIGPRSSSHNVEVHGLKRVVGREAQRREPSTIGQRAQRGTPGNHRKHEGDSLLSYPLLRTGRDCNLPLPEPSLFGLKTARIVRYSWGSWERGGKGKLDESKEM